MEESTSTQNHANQPLLTSQGVDHLIKTAKWGKFLAILGFIIIGLLIIGGIAFGAIMGVVSDELSDSGFPFPPFILSIIYIVIAVVYLFPVIYLNSFSNQTIKAASMNDTPLMESAFNNLRKLFTFTGILTIVVMAIYVIVLIGAGIMAAMAL